IRLRSVLLRSGLCRSAIHLRAGSGGCTAGVYRRFIRPEWKLGAGSKLLCGPAAVSTAAAAELSPAGSADAAELRFVSAAAAVPAIIVGRTPRSAADAL